MLLTDFLELSLFADANIAKTILSKEKSMLALKILLLVVTKNNFLAFSESL